MYNPTLQVSWPLLNEEFVQGPSATKLLQSLIQKTPSIWTLLSSWDHEGAALLHTVYRVISSWWDWDIPVEASQRTEDHPPLCHCQRDNRAHTFSTWPSQFCSLYSSVPKDTLKYWKPVLPHCYPPESEGLLLSCPHQLCFCPVYFGRRCFATAMKASFWKW